MGYAQDKGVAGVDPEDGLRVAVAVAGEAARTEVRARLRADDLRLVSTPSSVTALAALADASVDGTAASPSCDVVVVDADFAAPDQLAAAIGALAEAGCPSVVLADRPMDDGSVRLLLSGASGWVYRDTEDFDRLPDAVRTVAEGRAALDPEVARAVLGQWRAMRAAGGPAPRAQLSRRELEVLWGMADGDTGQAIARRLGLSAKTIEAHKSRIYYKLGARNQAHAISIAATAGLLRTDESPPS